MSKSIRSLIVLLVGGAMLVLVAQRLTDSPAFQVPKDFPEYWAAGRLNLRGENPYDPEKLLAEQRINDPDRKEALMMWNPPPALALYMPLGLLPIRLAGLIWVGVQLLAVLLACDLLWRQYHSVDKRWLAVLVGLMFVATWWMVSFGQNAGLILLGLAGYLHFSHSGRPLAAGACAAITALKPHLLAGFGLLLLADAVSRRGRITLLAGGSVIGLSLGVSLLANPNVIEQYLAATRNPGPGAVALHDWTLPVPAYWFRVWVDSDLFWLQFLPSLVACAGILIWRIWNRNEWNWARAIPWVVALSVLTTPYGWIFDQTVLLVPVIIVTSRLLQARQWFLLGLFLIGQLLVTVGSLAMKWDLHQLWWVAPSVLALCLFGISFKRK
jgi:hypothetical protein